MFHFVYNSYEQWGRNYIGVHSTNDLEDGYLGSAIDPTFKPIGKDILEFYETRKKAELAEIELHNFFDVANNSNFANLAKAHNTGSYPFTLSNKQKAEFGSKGGKVKSKKKIESATNNCRKGYLKVSKSVIVTNTLTNETFECYSCREASRKTGMHLGKIYDLVKGRKTVIDNWKIAYK